MTYIPEHFRETDRERLHAFLRDYPFGALVTVADGVPFASHLPFIYEAHRGAHGTLCGHMARANPQWRHLANAERVLAIFEGPHTYISPSWYAHPGVPTWNYSVVHVYGRPTVLDDVDAVSRIIERLTTVNEARFSPPWQVDLAEPRTRRMLDFIVGFEIEVTSIEGKFKMSQNRPEEDRRRVIEQLGRSESQMDRAVAEMMREVLAGK